jgi:hypothetical protein
MLIISLDPAKLRPLLLLRRSIRGCELVPWLLRWTEARFAKSKMSDWALAFIASEYNEIQRVWTSPVSHWVTVAKRSLTLSWAQTQPTRAQRGAIEQIQLAGNSRLLQVPAVLGPTGKRGPGFPQSDWRSSK